MKKICIALLASLACLFVVSCERQEEGNASVGSSKRFRIEAPQFLDENGQKVHLQFSESASNLIYDEGDVVYINGYPFSMTKSEGEWYATSDRAITAERFLVTYVDGEVGTYDSAAGTYRFNMNDNLDNPASCKAILGGVAENNGNYVISLQPACAILRIDTKGAGANYDYIKVGFDGNAIPAAGTINVSNRTLSTEPSGNYMNGVAQGGGGVINGDFLYMTRRHAGESDYWYVAIPIEGNSVTTTLYLEWTYNGGAQVQRKTQAPVTMYKGYVYTLGTERQSPFYANGSSKSYFQVSAGLQVRFSAGNLQYTRYEDVGSGEMTGRFRFANTQYAVAGEISNNRIGPYYQGWIDLFGWGTSGWNSGGGAAYEPYATTGTFKPGGSNDADLLGTYANSDWGVYNGADIYYGSAVSGLSSWRTLTDDEWNYLLTGRTNAASKYALATINGAYKGLILLPESWTLPAGLTFTPGIASGYSTNTYSLEDWDKMEMAGAIFLPAAGHRNGTSTNDVNDLGFYWSATHKTGMQANSLHFTSSTVAASTGKSRGNGCSVRLVKNR